MIDRLPVTVNPLPQLSGEDEAQQSVSEKVTVLIRSYQAISFHTSWTQDTISRSLGPAFRPLIDRIIVVWNYPAEPRPILSKDKRVIVLPQRLNSLNNHWIHTLPYIRTRAVLNLDDDVFVAKPGILCALHWWQQQPDRPVAPFVRRLAQHKHNTSELFAGEPHSVALPCFLLLHRHQLELCRTASPLRLRYVWTSRRRTAKTSSSTPWSSTPRAACLSASSCLQAPWSTTTATASACTERRWAAWRCR